MGGPKPPSPHQTARAQQGYNRASMRDALQYGQISQQNPYGSIRYEGAIGSPDRRQIVELNPQDQMALDARRQINAGLLSAVLGGGGQQAGAGKGGPAGQPMPRMQGGGNLGRSDVRRPMMMQREAMRDYNDIGQF